MLWLLLLLLLLLVKLIMGLNGTELMVNLVCSPFKAQVGGMHLRRACLMWSSSSLSFSWLVKTTFALFVNVLKTLYLAKILWLLSQIEVMVCMGGFSVYGSC